jgi:predicted RecA/RadA family phage recombinase
MATNIVFPDGDVLSVACTAPATPASGGPVLYGTVPGVALGDEDANGNTVVTFTGVAELSVKGVDANGNSAVAVGDRLYYTDGDTPKINKKATGTAFGTAMAAVGAASTATIRVRIG